jgi:hypothetical protein
MNGDAIQINRGRAEILLNPGSYLRLGDNTQIQLLEDFGSWECGF